MNPGRNKRSNVIQLTAGWCALLLYLGACSPLGLGMAALLGALDSNHKLNLTSGERGSRLVLHHERCCAKHHHGVVARTLTAFAQPQNSSDPDHILQFSSSDNLNFQSETSTLQPDNRDLSSACFIDGLYAHAPQSLELGVSAYPRPDDNAAQVRLRSTVLLI